MQVQKILQPTDFSKCSRAAYGVATAIAQKEGAAIELVHALSFPLHYAVFESAGTEMALEEYRETHRKQLKGEARRPEFNSVDVTCRLLSGYGPEVVAEHASDGGFDLIVLGSHGYKGFKRYVLGSFAERVLHLAKVPVVCVKGEGATEFAPRRILVPHDLTELSDVAFEPAAYLAKLFGGRVILVHAIQDLAGWPALSRDKLASQVHRRLLETAEESLEGTEFDIEVRDGDPVDVVHSVADDLKADLIVMATHSWSVFNHILMGSVAEKIVRGVSQPVLTVQPHKQAGKARKAESEPVALDT